MYNNYCIAWQRSSQLKVQKEKLLVSLYPQYLISSAVWMTECDVTK